MPVHVGDVEPKTMAVALRQIVIADVSMSLDNVLAVAGAARDNMLGKGQLMITSASLYELPVLAQIFNVIKFAPPDKTSFPAPPSSPRAPWRTDL